MPNCPLQVSSSSNYLLFFEIAHSSSGVECRIQLDDRVVWTIYSKICTCSDFFWKIWGIFGWMCYEGGGRKLLICPGNTGTECWCCWWLLSCLIWWPWSIKKGMTTTEKLMVYPYTIGLAKIFGEKSAKPHGGNWVKTWLHTNFESSRSDFYHDNRAPKVQILWLISYDIWTFGALLAW